MKALEPYLIYIVILFFTLLLLYIRTYITEKAKIKALISENKRLVQETESIKKDFQLEISRRKYQYEKKVNQYIEFFKLLDQFSYDSTNAMQDRFIPIIEEFNKNYFNASNQGNKRRENNAVVVMSKKTQDLMVETYQSLIRVKQETKSIRLMASDEVVKMLDLLEHSYEKNMNEGHKMMSDLPKQMMDNDIEGMQENKDKIELSSQVIKSIIDDIIRLMRKELNEI